MGVPNDFVPNEFALWPSIPRYARNSSRIPTVVQLSFIHRTTPFAGFDSSKPAFEHLFEMFVCAVTDRYIFQKYPYSNRAKLLAPSRRLG